MTKNEDAYRKLAAEIASDSIVTKALARFLEQVIQTVRAEALEEAAAAHQEDRLQNDREWRAKLDYVKAERDNLKAMLKGM